MSVHYVASLKIEKVDKDQRPLGQNGPKRDTTEVTQMVIKGDTLESLIRKLGAHIAIIEES